MLTALLAVSLWAIALPGIGSLPGVRSLFPDGEPGDRIPFRSVWGLALLGAAATAWNFFAAIGPAFALVALALGLAGGWTRRRELAEGLDRADAAAAGGLVLVLAVVAGFPVSLYDTDLYHLSLVRWMSAGPLPFGLANLHTRFGVSTFWFSVSPGMALPFAPGSEGYLPSIQIALVLALAAWSGLRKALRGTAGVPDLFVAAAFLPLVWAFLDRSLPSPSPDLAVVALTILSLASLGRAFGRDGSDSDLHRAAALAVVGAAVKLSAAPTAAAVVGVWAVVVLARRSRVPVGFAVGAALLLVPWAARNVALTGHVVFPVAATRIDGLAWSVPAAIAKQYDTQIRSWARRPSLPMEESAPLRDWVGPWLERNFRLLSWPVSAPAFYGVFLLAALPVLAVRRGLPVHRPEFLAPWAASAFGLVAWFLLAPDPRFALGTLFGFALLPLAAALTRIFPSPPPRSTVVPAAVAALLLVFGAVAAVEITRKAKGASHGLGWFAPPPPPVPPVRTLRTTSGLDVRVPRDYDRCSDSPLPCTPTFRKELSAERDASGRIRSFSLPPGQPADP